MKEFGKQNAAPAVREPFKLNYLNEDDESCVFEGMAAARASGSDFSSVMKAIAAGSPNVVDKLVRMLTKQMDNTDGEVKAKWQPVELDKPVDLDEDEEREFEPSYRGPDGAIYPFSDKETLARWENPANWTTRRRWVELMENDDAAMVELSDLVVMMEWIISLAANRPT